MNDPEPKGEKNKVLESGPLERLFAGAATAKMLDFLISSQEFDYSEKDIAKFSGVSTKTVQREIPKLVDYKLIKNVRPVGNAKMFQLDKSYKIAELAAKFAFELAKEDIHKEMKVAPKMKVKAK